MVGLYAYHRAPVPNFYKEDLIIAVLVILTIVSMIVVPLASKHLVEVKTYELQVHNAYFDSVHVMDHNLSGDDCIAELARLNAENGDNVSFYCILEQETD